MYRLTSKLIIYRNLGEDNILFPLSEVCEKFASGNYVKESLITEIYGLINHLLELSTRHGFDKNLWHNYLSFLLAMNENPFTLVSEKIGANEGSVNDFAKNDFCIFKQLFDYDFKPMEEALGISCFTTILNYKAVVKSEQIYNKSVSEKVQELSAQIEKAANEEELYQIVTGFYQKYGVGKIGLNKAFRVTHDEEYGLLSPITTTGDMKLDDLIGYEIQKQRLIDNTEAFVSGRRANNVLLFGDAGTGKSTSIKAILNQYYSRGLRMIEIYKHQFKDLSAIISEIKNRNYRVGKIGLNKAFRVTHDEEYGLLSPITTTGDMKLDDLIGYEIQKQRLIDNTEAFVSGRRANNVLLFGDAGTGKSTSIKAILNQYYSRGLRMIEIYKHQFKDLSAIISEIKNRNYRFIIYMDDLSFEEFEIEYKYLKAVIEGGLETKPENILIYATSNRRHLIRETWSDRSDMSKDELHRSDTMQEKLSLVARFGETIGFYKPSQKEYFEIVLALAKKYPEITLSEEEIKLKANQWELKHGGISGRTAQQFVNHLAGIAAIE